MELSQILKVCVVVLVGGGLGYGYYRWMLHSRSMDDARERGLAMILELGQVHANEHVRGLLTQHSKRRQRWQVMGACVAGTTTWVISLVTTDALDGAFGSLWIVGVLIGSALGGALSGLFPARSPAGSVRVTALQPHGLTDYLDRREIGLEAFYVLFGIITASLGIGVLLDQLDMGIGDETAVVLVVSGLLIAITSSGALLLQRALARAPLSAPDEDRLVVADVALAQAIRDLFVASAMLAAIAWCSFLFLPGRPWWVLASFIAVGVLSGVLVRFVVRRPNIAPVARQLTSKGAVA